MKNIIRITLFALSLTLLIGCSTQEKPIVKSSNLATSLVDQSNDTALADEVQNDAENTTEKNPGGKF